MNRFKNILAVCSDALGGDDVIGQASALAVANGARLTLVSISRERETSNWRDEQLKRLRRTASAIESEGLRDVQIRVLTGSPAVSLVQEVVAHGHDIVIMCRDIDDSLGDLLVGGTASRMMRNCPCPVWLLRPGQQVPFGRVLAVVDPCLADVVDRDLDTKILEIAASLATTHGAVLHVANVWEVDGPDYDTMRSEMRPKDREELIARHEKRRLAAMAELLEPFKGGGLKSQIHLPRSTPHSAIRDLTTDLSIDVMVMRADDVSHLSFLLGGSLAEGLLKSVPCSLLAVTPDGFVKPLAAGVAATHGTRREPRSDPGTRLPEKAGVSRINIRTTAG